LPAASNVADDVPVSGLTYTLAYSDRGRLKSATLAAGTVSYVYNALEQRVRKSGPTSLVATGAVLYVYDEAGRLLGDYNNSLRVLRETVYLGEMPIVVLGQTVAGSPANYTTQVYHVYCDQIGTPRVITQATTNKMRWRWDSAEPFGTTAAQENPAAVGVFGYDPRFAGQMRDKETGLHYNWHRDYDALVGRYVQSDPIGLAGGINTYAYAGENPVSYIDPDGLNPLAIGIGVGGRVIGGRAAAGAISAAARRYGPAGMAAACLLAGVCTFQDKTPNEGEPGSCHVNPGSGQERKYGADGKPDYDIDWDHGHGQGVPHGHNWGRGPNGQPIRGPGVPISPWPRGRGPGG